MNYSQLYLNRQSVKVPVPIFLIVVSLISFFLTRILGGKPSLTYASKVTLKQLQIVNLLHNQAGVFWQTEKKEKGWIIYGEEESKLDKIVLDERDTAEQRSLYLNHYVLIKNLKENQKYFFKIVNGNQIIADIKNQPFYFETAATVVSSSNLAPAYGKVISSNGQPVTNGVVVLTFKDSYPLVSLLKLSGEWLIPLNSILDKSTNKIKNISTGALALIEIYGENGEKSSINAFLDKLSPLPQTIILGKNYEFITKEEVLSATDQTTSVSEQISIIFPKTDGVIPADRPLIKGTAIPGADVVVIINSSVSYSMRTKADRNGVWRIIPKESLSAGKHTVTIITTDSQGNEVKLTRQFTIAKSGEQVLGNATPEPTLVATPTATPIIVLTPTIASTPIPTIYKTGFSFFPFFVAATSLIVIGIGIILAY